MSHLLSIRSAYADEAMELAAIGYLAWEKSILPLQLERPGLRQVEQRRLTNHVQQSVSTIIVADLQGEVIGWCSRSAGRAYIPYLFVAPHRQGFGVGGALLSRMESLLELEGRERVMLETPADHVRAVRFYEQQGYHILAVKAEGSRPGPGPLTSIRLEKRLQPFRGPIHDADD
jgi:GNAT superfamily N-acetyltransferase